MSKAAIAYISSLMDSLDIPYAFMEWKKRPPDSYYFVGEYNESAMMTREEDGRQETTLYLRGFTRGDWLTLEEAKQKIENAMGMTAILPDGNGIAVFYDGATVVPTGDEELKSIKINLTIQEWSVS